MAGMPLTPRVWTSQPQYPVGIASPFANRLTGAWLAYGGSPLFNAASSATPVTAFGSPTFPFDSAMGQVVSLNGTTQYLRNSAFTTSGNTYPLMLSAWFKVSSLGAGNQTIIALTPSGGTGTIFQLYTSSTAGNSLAARQYNTGTIVNSVAALSAGVWYMGTVVFAGLSDRKLYLNGVLVASDTTTASPPSAMNQVDIGASPWAGPGEYFPGSIAQPLVLNWNPSAAEVFALYRNSRQLFAPSTRRIYTSAAAGGTSASVAVTDGADVLAGSVGPIVGVTSAKTDGADVLAANVSAIVATSSSTTDGADVLVANVAPVTSTNSVTSATTDGADTLVSSVSVIAAASSSTTDGADTLTGNLSPLVAVSSAKTDGADVLAGNIASSTSTAITSATTDGADVLASSVGPIVGVTSATTDGADVLVASVGPRVDAISATTDGADVLAASIGPLVGVASTTTDGADVLVANVAPVQSVAISASLTEGADTLAASVSTPSSRTGGDDRPERVEVYERNKPKPKKDDTLDTAVRAAFDKAMGRAPAAVSIVQPVFDDEEDDIEALMMVL